MKIINPKNCKLFLLYHQINMPSCLLLSCCFLILLPLFINAFCLVPSFSCTSTQCSKKAMAPHSSTHAWKIPWTEEPGGLQSMGSLGVGCDWATSLSLFPFMHWRRKWQPTPVFLPGESQGWGSQRAAVYGVAQSLTRLKRLNSSSSSSSSTQC